MIGTIAQNFHEGSRSEYLAAYVLSAFGTVAPVPHHEDTGLDLYCTLTKAFGRRAMVTAYYSVQVKSQVEPWIFNGPEEIQWLLDNPVPLFLCIVNKKSAQIQIYQTLPRYLLAAHPPIPQRVTFVPEDRPKGEYSISLDEEAQGAMRADGIEYSLQTPILSFSIEQFLQEKFRETASSILKEWVDLDLENHFRLQANMHSFLVPGFWVPNERPHMRVSRTNYVSGDRLSASKRRIEDAIGAISAAMPKEDRVGGLLGAMLLRHWFGAHHSPTIYQLNLATATTNEELLDTSLVDDLLEQVRSKGRVPPDSK